MKRLKKYGRSDSHLYFIRRTPDRLKIRKCKNKDGEDIKILMNETSINFIFNKIIAKS